MNKDENVNELLYEILQATLESGKRMGYAQGRDETAREILKWIDEPFTEKEIRNLIAINFGIELE